jgi:hypothetical protein
MSVFTHVLMSIAGLLRPLCGGGAAVATGAAGGGAVPGHDYRLDCGGAGLAAASSKWEGACGGGACRWTIGQDIR